VRKGTPFAGKKLSARSGILSEDMRRDASEADPNGFSSANAEGNEEVQAGSVEAAWTPVPVSLRTTCPAFDATPFSAPETASEESSRESNEVATEK